MEERREATRKTRRASKRVARTPPDHVNPKRIALDVNRVVARASIDPVRIVTRGGIIEHFTMRLEKHQSVIALVSI